MGYQTRYKLSWTGQSETTKATCPHCGGTGSITIRDPIREVIEKEKLVEGDETIAAMLDEPVKWYLHEDDLVTLSKRFPDVVFTLHGVGEEPEDIWIKYFKGGKVQTEKAEFKIASFDEAKLI